MFEEIDKIILFQKTKSYVYVCVLCISEYVSV